MNTQQFFKGLLMSIVSVAVAAFSTTPIDFLLLAVTAVCTILTYTGKNLIPWFHELHSDSPSGTLSLVNFASALLIALGAGILQYTGTFLIEGSVDWAILLKVVLSVTFTYLGTTWFAPPYSTEKKRLFASKTYISRYMKGAAVIVLLLGLSAGASAQGGVFEGFFKPKAGTAVSAQFKAEGDKSHEVFVRPAASMNAIIFSYDKDLKAFRSSTFSSAGLGLGVQWYTERNGTLVNTYGVNALVILDASQGSSGAGAALTVNCLQFVNVGFGYSWTNKEWFIPVGAVWNF